jgi:hypothetical protein
MSPGKFRGGGHVLEDCAGHLNELGAAQRGVWERAALRGRGFLGRLARFNHDGQDEPCRERQRHYREQSRSEQGYLPLPPCTG